MGYLVAQPPLPLSPSATSSSREQRSARKKPSIKSLPACSDSRPPPAESSSESPSEPLAPQKFPRPRTSYFECYPRDPPGPSDPQRAIPAAPERGSSSVSKSTTRVASHRKGKERKDCPVAFPTTDTDQDALSPLSGHERNVNIPRLRTRTIPGQLRFSGSSSQTQYESPPQTPIEVTEHNSLDSIRVVVAAPIAGVETMDALVDGMNTYDDDELFRRMGSGSKLGKMSHHPLYHPPLPKPPPGIVLGGGKPRIYPSHSDEEERSNSPYSSQPTRRHRRSSSSPSHSPNNRLSTFSQQHSEAEHNSANNSIEDIIRKHRDVFRPNSTKPKSSVPSITDIIRKNAHASHSRSYTPTPSASSHGHHNIHEESDPEPNPATTPDIEVISRSSIDSIAEEVQKTLRHHSVSPIGQHTLEYSRSFSRRPAGSCDTSLRSRNSVSSRRPDSTIYSSSISTMPPGTPVCSPELEFGFLGPKKSSPKDVIAKYLRSTRLTTITKLTRPPHASHDHPLTVSLSDLGSPHGFPLVVFLGLGCVRYVMGLYDEMAECLGLRLITIDRWGLGRTDTPHSPGARGILEWATVVEEILDRLQIERCSIMAHSAGAPYALAFANKFPGRVVGDVCLLAPWVGGGEGAGYRWLKYIPNSLLKTAQAAEWKVQAWMLGKPPTLAFEGIGYDVRAPISFAQGGGVDRLKPTRAQSEPATAERSPVYPSSTVPLRPRPSVSSGTLSEYDDLGDFEGRFESRSTLSPRQRNQTKEDRVEVQVGAPLGKRKTSRGFLGIWRGNINKPGSQEEAQPKPSAGRRLKTLKSISSLRSVAKSSASHSPKPPQPEPAFGVGLGIGDVGWRNSGTPSSPSTISSSHWHGKPSDLESLPRSSGRRSVSFTSSTCVSSPSASAFAAPLTGGSSGTAFQTALGNALIAASHAESSKGTHSDLLQILNHDQKPWGFSYGNYPHKVRVWYGDKDERIAEHAVRWMEKNMGEERCMVNVVKGADHGLMYRSSVVVDVMEQVSKFWQDNIYR